MMALDDKWIVTASQLILRGTGKTVPPKYGNQPSICTEVETEVVDITRIHSVGPLPPDLKALLRIFSYFVACESYLICGRLR